MFVQVLNISMTQHSEYEAPIHNSIAPLNILLNEGVNIGLGVDNVEDIFMHCFVMVI